MTTQTVTGLYDSYDAATKTVSDLEAANIPHTDISIVAHRSLSRCVGRGSYRGRRWSACRSGDSRYPGSWPGGRSRLAGRDGSRGGRRGRRRRCGRRSDRVVDLRRRQQGACKLLRGRYPSRRRAGNRSRRRTAGRNRRGDHEAPWPHRPHDARENLPGRRLERSHKAR